MIYTNASKHKNDRKIAPYVVKNTFLLIAGVRRPRAFVHVGAETVPMRYLTPAHTHTRPRTRQQNDIYI